MLVGWGAAVRRPAAPTSGEGRRVTAAVIAAAARRARHLVNGVLTELFPVDAELPPYDPLSPLLLNLFETL